LKILSTAWGYKFISGKAILEKRDADYADGRKETQIIIVQKQKVCVHLRPSA